jgi:hypothetical protein
MVRGHRAGHIPARVQVGDVERPGMAAQIFLETDGKEELQMVSQMV